MQFYLNLQLVNPWPAGKRYQSENGIEVESW